MNDDASTPNLQLPTPKRRFLGIGSWGLGVFLFATATFGQVAASSVWDGVFTDAQSMRGQMTYQSECAGCHGTSLEGGDMTPPLVGGAFTSNWNDLTLGDLFERIRVTMPLDKPGRLTRQQNADVIAYLLKSNTWPAGENELPPDPGAMKQIKIAAIPPQGRGGAR